MSDLKDVLTTDRVKKAAGVIPQVLFQESTFFKTVVVIVPRFVHAYYIFLNITCTYSNFCHECVSKVFYFVFDLPLSMCSFTSALEKEFVNTYEFLDNQAVGLDDGTAISPVVPGSAM